jgi:glycosyltransferase involved in cell wall biosynthesis
MIHKPFLFCFPGPWSVHPQFHRLLKSVEILCQKQQLQGHVLLMKMSSIPELTKDRGIFSSNSQNLPNSSLEAHQLPVHPDKRRGYRFVPAELKAFLHKLNPSYVYIHGEFWDEPTLQFLSYYRFTSQPYIVAYAALCHATKPRPLFSKVWPFISRTSLWYLALWGRLDGVSACSTPSLRCARRLRLPGQVPARVSFLPVLGPEEVTATGVTMPWPEKAGFTLGFAGLFSKQKGWRVLFQALELLPGDYRLFMAGDGPDREEVNALRQAPALSGRVFCAGLLPQNTLLATLPSLDILVLPSLTLPDEVEQFGAVLAEAMAWGVPVIGSDSGAIPETIGDAGLVVPEGDPGALARAIQRVCLDEALSRDLAAKGLARYRRYYSCEAYADSLAGLFGLGA